MNRRRLIGFFILLFIAFLFLWASVTGGGADIAAAILTPSYLKES